ncbi:hypothetical protein STSP2_02894 [Anaerohalosphaera lusitana]|uniref:Methanolan biosynthesis EpsI domain-containing protein n=1 Tax=Anaerohalosphaera lusitana TaxID=1936003 RepID=A0A1U9NP68_9BACT|nr:hypothetical protein [Anaerohalosphaera lusitana]AQT69699.1 hypothetical protein STSP2_02894 [Anaerohalosphaera lusitana]
MKENLKEYMKPAFLVCVAILAVAAFSKEAVVKYTGVKLNKKALPLQASFSELDKSDMGRYKVVDKSDIPKEIEDELGAQDYIKWVLEDTEAEEFSPTRFCLLFITYYTGNPDQVPHVPEECYVGGGNSRRESKVVTLDLAKSNGEAGSIPAELETKLLMFARESKDIFRTSTEFPVMYFFKTNGQYASGRGGVRAIMGRNFTSEYSYFSKVEWNFYGGNAGRLIYPDEEQTIEASENLMKTLLPLFEKKHWPDWEKANSESDDADEFQGQ